MIPVYLVLGMLDSGKTTFIKNALTDFDSLGRTLVLICESGEAEYTVDSYRQITFCEIETEANFNPEYIAALSQGDTYDQVVIEYNGMWNTASIPSQLPYGWFLQQCVSLFDATTFELYLKNMSQQISDKIRLANMSVWNRCTDSLASSLRKNNLRILNRKSALWLQYQDGQTEDYRNGLTSAFDLSATEITIPNDDYAIWYAEIMDQPDTYNGKYVRFQGVVADGAWERGYMVGRIIMTCCEKDMELLTIACDTMSIPDFPEKPGTLAEVEGVIHSEYIDFLNDYGPVLVVTKCHQLQ